MTADLKGKTALVTGSGKKAGIGYGIVRRLADCGANVIIADLVSTATGQNESLGGRMEEMTRLAKDLQKTFKVKAMAFELDVTRQGTITKMVAEVQKQYSRIHVLCNNAGTVLGVPNAIRKPSMSTCMGYFGSPRPQCP
jgi:NAD(P)-dependent dehydrogenase (short-subunit alcohol dehydrogenase family)